MKRKTWRSKLTKGELHHLKVVGGVTDKAGLERTFKQQAQDRINFPKTEPCWECKAIARKLGMLEAE